MTTNLRRFLLLSSTLILMVAFSFLAISLFTSDKTTDVLAQSAGFQAGHIIDNNIFINSNALNVSQIQAFLNDMVGTCDTNGIGLFTAPNGQVMTHAQWGTSKGDPPPYTCINSYYENLSTLQNNYSNPGSVPGGAISAAQIIYNAAQAYQINPEVILTTLQKEQGLVTDNWPWYSEYQYAMGYSCPDSSGCSSSYADFYKQVDGAAWQFRDYLNNPGAFNYWIGTNTIEYAPGCAGGTVDIQNAATAALYIYTPYQPDSNVLASTNPVGSPSGPGPGISDSCAAYGNRNFWWYFNSWFGPSVDTNISLVIESGGSTVYVLYDGQKQGIPTPDVLDAWGLYGLPLTTLDPAVFNAIPTAPTVLNRYAYNSQTGQSYFADNGNLYYASTNDVSMWGNFGGQTPALVTSTLINFANYQGEIKPFVHVSGNPAYYAVDNGSLHPITSLAAYDLWAGPAYPMQLSSAFFSTMPQASYIGSPEFTFNDTNYILSDGEQFSLSNTLSSLMPSGWTDPSIGQGLFNIFQGGGSLHYMLLGNNSSTIYLLDAGTLRGIPDPQTASAYQADPGGDTSIVSNDLINFFPSGAVLSGTIVTFGSQSYVINQALQPIPSNLVAAYDPTNSAISLSPAYQSIFSIGSNVTAFVKSTSSPGIYFLDNDAKLPFISPVTFNLVAGNTGVTSLTDNDLQLFPTGAIMQNYITNGSSSYLIDEGRAYSIPSSGMANAWKLSNPVTVSSTATSSFPSIGKLSQLIQMPNGYFCLVDSDVYCANVAPLVTMWGFPGNNLYPSQLLMNSLNFTYLSLSPFATASSGQPGAGTVYVAAKGSLLGIATPSAAINLGINNFPIMTLDSFTLSSFSAGQVWQGYLANDDSGGLWALDAGYKHSVPTQYQSAWLGNSQATLLGSDFLSLLPTSSPMTLSIETPTGTTVYGMVSGQKDGIPTFSQYFETQYDPFTIISPNLEQEIPSGPVL